MHDEKNRMHDEKTGWPDGGVPGAGSGLCLGRTVASAVFPPCRWQQPENPADICGSCGKRRNVWDLLIKRGGTGNNPVPPRCV